MACFLVPAAEAVITTITAKIARSHEAKNVISDNERARLSEKLKSLNNMLWGGSALLAFEHIWHGEVEPFFPFLTAASDPAATSEMLHEIATSGTAMAALVTAAWAVMTYAQGAIKSKADGTAKERKAEAVSA